MNIDILSIGQKMPVWVALGFAEYNKRMPKECSVNLIEIKAISRTKNNNTTVIKKAEYQAIQKIIAKKNNAKIIALDERGKVWSTQSLSADLKIWRDDGLNIVFLIGGADGLDEQCLKNADKIQSLSKLTLPHQLVRVVLAEQIYRAWSLLNNHPYHRV